MEENRSKRCAKLGEMLKVMFFIFILAIAATRLHNRYINMPINIDSPDHNSA